MDSRKFDRVSSLARSDLKKLARKRRLVKRAFQVFAAAVYPGASEAQLRELKIAFFAGAAELYALTMGSLDLGDEEPTQSDMDFISNVDAEITAFHERTVKLAFARQKGRAN